MTKRWGEPRAHGAHVADRAAVADEPDLFLDLLERGVVRPGPRCTDGERGEEGETQERVESVVHPVERIAVGARGIKRPRHTAPEAHSAPAGRGSAATPRRGRVAPDCGAAPGQQHLWAYR